MASRVNGVGKEIVAGGVKAFPGGEARVARGGPGTEVVEVEFTEGKEEVPEAGEGSGMDSSEGGDNVVFSSLDGAFG